MSADATTLPGQASEAHAHEHHGPTDKKFVTTALILAAITAVEVAWSYLPWGDWGHGFAIVFAEVGGLLIMMAVKFYIVASVFMHLKYDSKVLTRVFYAGLALAVAVYLAVLATFEIFSGGLS
jgi:cytochrome c oxidase subunit 4